MYLKAKKPGSSARGAPTGASNGRAKNHGVPSIVSPDLKIIGDLKSSGDIQLDGTVEGDIASRSLLVSAGAVVRGAISTDSVRVFGSVFGKITANQVVLTNSAKIEGDIAYRTLTVEAGASLLGKLTRRAEAQDETHKITAEASTPAKPKLHTAAEASMPAKPKLLKV